MRRYVWKCDKKAEPLARVELRIPEDLRDLLQAAAKIAECSLNAYMIAVLECVASEEVQAILDIDVRRTPVKMTMKRRSPATKEIRPSP